MTWQSLREILITDRAAPAVMNVDPGLPVEHHTDNVVVPPAARHVHCRAAEVDNVDVNTRAKHHVKA
jgi:hypothetical protein